MCPSVRRSVRNAFVKIAENGIMQDEGASRAVYPALLFVELSENFANLASSNLILWRSVMLPVYHNSNTVDSLNSEFHFSFSYTETNFEKLKSDYVISY